MNANKFDMKDSELEIIATCKHSIIVPSLDCIMMTEYFQRQKSEEDFTKANNFNTKDTVLETTVTRKHPIFVPFCSILR